MSEAMKTVKRLEEQGVSFEVEGETLWVRGNTKSLREEDKAFIKTHKPTLIETLQDRQRLADILLEDVEIAADHRQLSLFIEETQKAFSAGQLSRGQTEQIAKNVLRRGRMVPPSTGTKAVLYRDSDEEMKNFPRRASWRTKS